MRRVRLYMKTILLLVMKSRRYPRMVDHDKEYRTTVWVKGISGLIAQCRDALSPFYLFTYFV